MISILKASEDYINLITHIGYLSVEEAHRDSCSEQDMKAFLNETYNTSAIQKELKDPKNIYHVLSYKGEIVGFSKIILNARHSNITGKNVSKLDRIYLLKEFHDRKLGFELLKFNIQLAKQNNQSGIWLFTWIGNTRAVNFYLKAGFKIVGSHRFKVTDTHYNEHHQMFLDISNN